MQHISLTERLLQIWQNRYFQLGLLTVGLAVVFYLLCLFLFPLLHLGDFPKELLGMFSVLGAGLVVYKFFAGRIF